MLKDRESKKTVAMYTLGCKVNQFETQAMEQLFASRGYGVVDFESVADIYVINTCTVTAMSDRKSRQMIRRAKKQNPDATVVVVGCYSQKSPEEVLAIEGVDLVMGTSNRDKIVEEVEHLQRGVLTGAQRIQVENIMSKRSFEPLIISDMREKTRAFLKIQEGCDRFCSYCIIPFTRGPVRSQGMKDILAQVQELVKKGFQEVVLTGIHVASYGKDLGEERLEDVIEEIAAVRGLQRIRTSSVEPLIITDAFLDRIRLVEKFCPHFHLSLQSGCDSVLRRMNRRYDTSMYRAAVEKIRTVYPQAAITTDVIVGFPGETEEEFMQTYEFLQDISLYEMHVFKYSVREGTAAAKMKDQVTPEAKNKRSEKVLALAARNKRLFEESFIGQTEEVLFETAVDGGYEGHTKNYMKVFAPSIENLEGKRRMVLLQERTENFLIGKCMDCS